MPIKDLSTYPHGLKPNHALNLLLSSKPSMKPTQQSVINKNAIKANINWLTDQIKSLKKNINPIKSNFSLNWQWQSNDITDSIVSEDLKSVCFHSNCSSCFETTAVRGAKALKKNAFTYWEITILNKQCTGTSLMIGIGTAKANMKTTGYLNLIGSDQFSYGLAHTGHKWHANKSSLYCDQFESNGPVTIGCLFDGYKGTLSYYKDNKCLGIAFDNLFDQNDSFYPMVSSTVAQSVFRLECAYQNMPSLQELCRQQVVNSQLNTSQLPKSIVNYINRNY